MGKNRRLSVVILAAGKSKRMNSSKSKIVHKILGKEIINYLLDSLINAGIEEERIILVAGKNIDEIKSAVSKNVRYAIQEKQLGTADALLSAESEFYGKADDLLVVVGDNPYISKSEIERFVKRYYEQEVDLLLLSALFPQKPPPYGRLIRDKNGSLLSVVEEIDATQSQLKIREVNSSVYLFNLETIFPLLKKIDNNNSKREYYLTDIVKLSIDQGLKADAFAAENFRVSIGINNRWELAGAERDFNLLNLKKLAEDCGVTILNPETVTIEHDVKIGRDTVIYPNVYIAGGTVIGKNCKIGPFVFLKGSNLPDNSSVSFKKLNSEI